MSTERVLVAVDRLEGDQAVLEGAGEEFYHVGVGSLPPGATVGSVLDVRVVDGMVDEGAMELDAEATAERRAAASEILAELRKRDPGGNVIL